MTNRPPNIGAEINKFLTDSSLERSRKEMDAKKALVTDPERYAGLDEMEFAEALRRDFGLVVHPSAPNAKYRPYGPK